MSAWVSLDVVEQILLGLDVKDIIRCKSVCKSWCCLISSSDCVRAHLKHQNNNIGGQRRISLSNRPSHDEYSFYVSNLMIIVGSCNGLVCVSPKGSEFEVVNPCTGVIKKLQTARFFQPNDGRVLPARRVLIMGFGYDDSTDDYKVVAGYTKRVDFERGFCMWIEYYVLSLKSNVWKFIGRVKYSICRNYCATFCGGALHWFVTDGRKKVIMSVDLSTDECKEIPQPAAAVGYRSGDLSDHNLGVIEGCLCVYSSESSKIWVMKNNKWELYNKYNNECRYDTAHLLKCHPVVDSQDRTSYVYTIDDGKPVPCADLCHLRANIFVESLVTPQVKELLPEAINDDANGNIRKSERKRKKRKKRKRSCKR